MNEYLMNKAIECFDTYEKWLAFVELCSAKDLLVEDMLINATVELREYFTENLSEEWGFAAWDNGRDTWWYLKRFGMESIGIGFGWRYWLCLGKRGAKLRNSELQTALSDQYSPILEAFGPIDNRELFEFAQERNFYFGLPSDGRISIDELAGCSKLFRSKFMEQAKGKIECFTNDPEMTKLLIQLNKQLGIPEIKTQ